MADTLREVFQISGAQPTVEFEPVPLGGGWSAECLRKLDLVSHETIPTRQLPSRHQWISFLDRLTTDPESLPDGEILKHAKSTMVLRTWIPCNGGRMAVVCKQTQSRGAARRFASVFVGTRAHRNRKRAWALIRAGIGTAMPLAMVHRGGARNCQWLVSHAITDTVDLDQVALSLLNQLDRRRLRRVKDDLIAQLVDLLVKLETNGIRHRDLKASNFLLTDWDGQDCPPRVWIVDLDGMRASSSGRRDPKVTQMGMTRLTASLRSYASVTRTDYLRFLHLYLDRSQPVLGSWKLLFRMCDVASKDYAQRSQRRKRDKLDGFRL